MAQAFTPDQFHEVWQPHRPLAGAKTGPKRRMSRTKALDQSYIEANVTSVLQSLVIVDHDDGEASRAAHELGLPPSWVAATPDGSDHGHLVYALGGPVCLTDCARRPPVNYLARIEHGLNNLLGGDPAYAGTFTKNPHHQDHLTLWGPASAVYGLHQLATALRELHALPAAGKPRRNVTTSSVGRNVALFDILRHYAYPRRGNHTNPHTWETHLHHYATEKNQTIIANEFTKGPLRDGELNAITRSVARWTWRNITRTLSQEQARRARMLGAKRRQTRQLIALDPEVT